MLKTLFFTTVICVVCLITSGCESTAQYYYESAITQMEDENYEAALSSIQTALADVPDKKEYILCEAMIQVSLGKYSEAIDLFDSVINEDATDVIDLENNKSAYRGKGIAYLKEKSYDKALEAFDKALTYTVLEELDDDLVKFKAEVMVASGDYENAHMLYTSIIEAGYIDVSMYVQKCICELKLEKFDDAKNTLVDISKINNDPSYKVAVYCEIVSTLMNTEKYDEAIRMIDEVKESAQGDAKQVLLHNEIIAYERKSDFNTAYQKAKEYVSLYPNDTDMVKECEFIETRIESSEENVN